MDPTGFRLLGVRAPKHALYDSFYIDIYVMVVRSRTPSAGSASPYSSFFFRIKIIDV